MCVEFEFLLGPLKTPKLRTAVSWYQPSSTGTRLRWIKMIEGSWDVEFQERIPKEWACLHPRESFSGFGLHRPSAFKPDRPNSKKSKLQQFRKWKVEIQDSQLGRTGMGRLPCHQLQAAGMRARLRQHWQVLCNTIYHNICCQHS